MMPPRHGQLRNTQLPRRGLSAAVGWTVANAALPGMALLKSGRKSGWIFLILFLGIPIAAVAGYFLFDGMSLILKFAVRPTALGIAALCLVAAALVWAVLMLVGNHLLNALFGVEGRKRTVSILAALALIAGAAVPAVSVVRSLEAQRSLLVNSFASDHAPDESGSTNSVVSDSQEDPWAGEPQLNVMLLGHDSGEGRTGTRPDTIMVASIDTSSGVTSLFSIPRNLQYVQFPSDSPMNDVFPNGFDAYGPNQNLLNAVWNWAADHPNVYPESDQPGLLATRQAVEHTLGLEVDRYGMVNLAGFEEIINALGGVEIVVERRIPIGGGTNQYTGAQKPIHDYIEPGKQVLNGHDALWYARSREGSSDFDRMCRQQRMMQEVTESVNPAAVASSFVELVQATENNVSTSIRISELDAMVDLLMRVREQGITSHPITPEVTNPANPDFEFLQQWVEKRIKADAAEATQQSDPDPETGSTTSATGGSGSPTETAPDESGTSSPTPEASQTSSTGSGGAGEEAEEGALAGCMP